MLGQGNTAKMYCLQRIADIVSLSNRSFSLLDLGSGTSSLFVPLLQRFPHIRYVGVEPDANWVSEARKATQSLNVEIVHASAYGLELGSQFDFITSFSVLEHVDRRGEYFESARRHLSANGIFLINYDSGHFVHINKGIATIEPPGDPRGMVGDTASYYERFVAEAEFVKLVADARLSVRESLSFNSWLKRHQQFIRTEQREEFCRRWLELELWMNRNGIPYEDNQAPYYLSRNHLLTHREA